MKKTKGILLLSGPPGCGKDTAVKSLCHELNIGVTEWQNVSSGDNERYLPSTCNDFESIKDESCVAFIDFIHSATLYGTNKRFSVVIIKEIPHIFEKYPNEFEQIILNVWFSNFCSLDDVLCYQN